MANKGFSKNETLVFFIGINIFFTATLQKKGRRHKGIVSVKVTDVQIDTVIHRKDIRETVR